MSFTVELAKFGATARSQFVTIVACGLRRVTTASTTQFQDVEVRIKTQVHANVQLETSRTRSNVILFKYLDSGEEQASLLDVKPPHISFLQASCQSVHLRYPKSRTYPLRLRKLHTMMIHLAKIPRPMHLMSLRPMTHLRGTPGRHTKQRKNTTGSKSFLTVWLQNPHSTLAARYGGTPSCLCISLQLPGTLLL